MNVKLLQDILDNLFEQNKDFHEEKISNILHSFRETINPNLTEKDIKSVFIQHVLTNTILDTIFETYNFKSNNPLSKKFTELETDFFKTTNTKLVHE